ncbi:hypothetical protein Agub_g15259 [Astrephomene gubernaculifera]|uniref:Uncharacterized protein n=1 Tax=Astrephomene gubernaculifera TaxID=47775 RepID=A0AAD3E2Q8_9CHLO|nr:hypothetical protein Agub_g15259 [Astrephomene gubernaculifera]
MSQRNLLRGASRALAGLQSAARGSAGSSHGSSSFMLNSLAGKLQTGSATRCQAVMGSLRSCGVQVPAAPTYAPMGFAASAPSVTGSLSVLGSVAQHRGVATTDSAEDGDGEDGVRCNLFTAPRDTQSALKVNTSGDKPPDDL